jgi:GR25 family glycosyltransferase involved in LPS biosynthesis
MRQTLLSQDNQNSVIIVSAVDANTLDQDAIITLQNNGLLNDAPTCFKDASHPGRPVLMGQIACFLSHYSLFEKSKTLNTPIVVLEDDMVILPDFQKKLQSVISNNSSNSNVDFINLFIPHYQRANPYFTSQQQSQLLPIPQWLHGFNCYYVNPKGAAKICDNALPMSMPIDDTVCDPIRFPDSLLTKRVIHGVDFVKDMNETAPDIGTFSNIWYSKTLVHVLNGNKSRDNVDRFIAERVFPNHIGTFIEVFITDSTDSPDGTYIHDGANGANEANWANDVSNVELLRFSGWYGERISSLLTLPRESKVDYLSILTPTSSIVKNCSIRCISIPNSQSQFMQNNGYTRVLSGVFQSVWIKQ